jgi:hypothetical protein
MQQRDIDPFVDNADEPEPRPRQCPDLGMRRRRVASSGEVLAIDAVGARLDSRVPAAARRE